MALLTDPAKIFASNVRRMIAQLGLTHDEVAHRAGMKPPRISEILRGDKDPRLGTVDRIARALGVPMLTLLHPVDQENSKQPLDDITQ